MIPLVALALQTIAWSDLSARAQVLANELGLTQNNFPAAVESIRTRNAARLREGELDHLIFYLLQSRDFTKEAPIDPAKAASEKGISPAIRNRLEDLRSALSHPADDRQKYFATLLATSLEEQLARTLDWIREKEKGCSTAPSPQTCIAALYQTRGHSSDTSPQSMAVVEAAFKRLERDPPKRVLVIGPGSDFAPRTAMGSGPVQTYQPRLLRNLIGSHVVIDCADLNPRVLRSAAKECDSTHLLDIATERLGQKYDAIIATNVLLYLNDQELLLSFQNISAMLDSNGVFIHNDTRFAAKVFGTASGIPALHFGTVALDPAKRPAVVDHFVIHLRAAAKP